MNECKIIVRHYYIEEVLGTSTYKVVSKNTVTAAGSDTAVITDTKVYDEVLDYESATKLAALLNRVYAQARKDYENVGD